MCVLRTLQEACARVLVVVYSRNTINHTTSTTHTRHTARTSAPTVRVTPAPTPPLLPKEALQRRLRRRLGHHRLLVHQLWPRVLACVFCASCRRPLAAAPLWFRCSLVVLPGLVVARGPVLAHGSSCLLPPALRRGAARRRRRLRRAGGALVARVAVVAVVAVVACLA